MCLGLDVPRCEVLHITWGPDPVLEVVQRDGKESGVEILPQPRTVGLGAIHFTPVTLRFLACQVGIRGATSQDCCENSTRFICEAPSSRSGREHIRVTRL